MVKYECEICQAILDVMVKCEYEICQAVLIVMVKCQAFFMLEQKKKEKNCSVFYPTYGRDGHDPKI